MYIFKNAIRSIVRSKGRNILIGIIIFVIAVSACLGLSIRQAAKTAKEETLDGITIKAQISVDRSSMMSNMAKPGEGGGFDKDAFKEAFSEVSSLTVEEMETYADLDCVADFYYTTTVSFDGSDEFEAVDSTGMSDETTEKDSEEEESITGDSQLGSFGDSQTMPGGDMGGNMGGGNMPGAFQMGTFGTQGDFTVVGYSSDNAMTDFINRTCSITEGAIFDEGTQAYECVISDELATYNNLSVGDVITLTNPNNEEETFDLTVIGIYTNSQSTITQSNMMGGFSTSTDAANQIYLSYTALKDIVDSSEANAEITTDDETGITTTTALPEQVSGTYVFATVEDYETFAEEVYLAGLSENNTVSSSDISQYEDSLLPLENLSEMSMYFLIVVLAIGAVVLIVLNIFSVRERKYEVGALTAIGMKKYKVSLQFMTEILVVTVVAVLLGAVVGSVTSVPVTNELLANQIEAQEEESSSTEEAFGRQPNMGGGMQGNMSGGMQGDMSGEMSGEMPEDMPSDDDRQGGMDMPGGFDAFKEQSTQYISEVTSATDMGVLVKLLGIGIGLALVSGAASVIFIMRYDPLKILANRD